MSAALFRLLVFLASCGAARAATDLDREIIFTPSAGAAAEDREIARWQDRASGPGARPEAFERLGWAYVAKARRTLDAGFYKLAEKTADVSDAQFGASADTRLLRGHIAHNLHRFAAAEAIARQLVAERGAPADYALLGDALMEQGRLADSVAAVQRLVDLKPGVEAYSRIAHLRWLKGDLAGATRAMETALAAAGPAETETQAWLLARLSGYVLQAGDAAQALRLAQRAGERLSDYPPALLASGRALLALGRTEAAIDVLFRAEQLQPLPEYQWWLADALAVGGRPAEAAKVVQRLKARGAENDPRTLALFLATRGEETATALRLARAELTQRGDVFSHDALAWALAATGELAAAGDEMRAALAERTPDARLLLHAGEIARRRGDAAAAAEFFARCRASAATLTPSERALLARRASPDALAAR